MRGFITVAQISLRDYFHERFLTACTVLGLAAVLAPLLLFFGVKTGVITTMSDRLIQDPRNREISPIGSGQYEKAWFSQMRDRDDISFIIPQTRSIASSMILHNRTDKDLQTVTVDLIPTGKGDPLLEQWGSVPKNKNAVVLSEPAARKLKVKAGQNVTGMIGRSRNGVKEHVEIQLHVDAVLSAAAFTREAAFVRLALLEATEDYRDGFGSEIYGWEGAAPTYKRRKYPSFRLYTRSIYDVAPLRDLFMDLGVDVYARVEEIEVVRNLDRSLTLIFRLIFAVAMVGCFFSLASSMLANTNRKSRHFGVMRIIGFSTNSILCFPIVQAITTSIIGTGVAIGLYLIAESIINHMFAQYLSAGEYVCRLTPFHMLLVQGLTMLMLVICSAFAAFRVAQIEPSEVIRDV